MPKITVNSTKQEILAAVVENSRALQYASEALKNDREVVLAAVVENGKALQYASEALKNDREVVLAAVVENGRALQYASEALKNDREVVLAAVAQYGRALQYASEALKNDREVVLAAVVENGLALRYASDELKNDRGVVLAAVAQQSWALQHASETLKNDPFLKRVSDLIIGNSAVFLALEPLKNKLKQETNFERKEAASRMIGAMENAIVNYYEGKDIDKFKQDVAQAISTALPVLEQQAGWKKVIDAVVNAIMNFISPKTTEQNQGKSTYRSYFFANPNPAAKELEDVEKNIAKEL